MSSAKIEKLELEITSSSKSAASGLDALKESLSKLKSVTDKATASMSKVPSVNKQAAKSYTELWSKMNIGTHTLKTVYNTLKKCVEKSSEYTENLNLFRVSMGKYADEAQAYAEKVGDVMGIDPGEWMRNQGIFMTLATGFGVSGDRAKVMSEQLTQLGYDISSFFNISYADAMQKLQSGLSGELEPLRRLGYDLSQAKLEATALSLGIDKSVSSMSQAEKAQLRYYAIMTQVTTAQGDMSRTLTDPANQMRIFKSQVEQTSRAIGNIFIPILQAILPVATAAAKAIRGLMDAIAGLWGFKAKDKDFSGLGGVTDGVGDIEGALDDATDSAKKLKSHLLGFDELNVLNPNTSGDSLIGEMGDGFDFELPTYDFIGDAVSKQIDEIETKISLAIKDVFYDWGRNITAESLLEKVVTGLATIGGTIIGFKLGGIKGAVIGAVLGLALSLAVNTIAFDHDGKLSTKEVFDALKHLFIVGTAGILGFYLGGAKGAMFGLTLGFGLTMFIESIDAKGNTGLADDIESSVTALIPAGLGVALGAKFGDTFWKGFMGTKSLLGSGFGKSFESGLMGVSASMTTGQKGVTGVVGGLAEVLGVYTGVENMTYDIANGTADAASILTDTMPVVTGTAAGWVALSIALGSTGVGAVAAGVIALASGLVGVVDGIERAGEAAYERTETFSVLEGILDNSAINSDKAATALATMKTNIEGIDDVTSDFILARKLLPEIMTLSDKTILSNDELATLHSKVEIFNELELGGIQLEFDETKTAITATKDEIEALLTSMERKIKMEALEDMLVDAYRTQYEMEEISKTTAANLDIATKAYDEASDAWLDAYESTWGFAWDYLGAGAEEKAALAHAEKALDEAKAAHEEVTAAYEEAGKVIDTYLGELEELKKADLGLEDAGEEMSTGLLNGVQYQLARDEQKWLKWAGKPNEYMREVNDINSPSKVFEENGVYIGEGLLNGLDKSVLEKDYLSIFGRVNTALTSVKAQIGNTVNNILGFVEKMVNGVIDSVNGLIRRLNSFRINVPDWITEMSGISDFGFNIEQLSHLTIPRIKLMADGGYVNSGQMFIAREAGAEMVGSIGRRTAVANNDQIVAGIAHGVAEANDEQNELLREQNELLIAMLDKETGVYIDGKAVTKSVEKHQRERGRVLVTGGAY